MIIAVIGLGYVGAPLAIELGLHFTVLGFDINKERVAELIAAKDRTGEISAARLENTKVEFTTDAEDIAHADMYIVTVPTPVSEANVPDLSPVLAASRTVGRILKKGDIVVFESTVYPGVTEEVCVPVLEHHSELTWKKDFNVGYSPERINPGDKTHTLTTTTKVVSGDSLLTLDRIDLVYSRVTKTYRASTIKVAEGAKVIENTQRDVNIALMNELSHIFTRLGVDTNDVIDAAASKWNFQPFRPGLVGGHCISVDPYYLSHKAAQQGFVADVILSSREINDSMASFIVDQLVKRMSIHRMLGANPIVTILGCTFKENVPDIRNSKVFNVIAALKQYGIVAQVYDPHADAQEVFREYGVKVDGTITQADAIVLAVPHAEFMTNAWETVLGFGKGDKAKVVVMDVKGVLNRDRLPDNVDLWRP